MANFGQPVMIDALPISIQHVNTIIAPEYAPIEMEERKCAGIFEHNIGLIQDLMEKDFHYGRIYILPKIQQTTTEQIVNLLSRSKQRRRKQIFDERIGKVRPNWAPFMYWDLANQITVLS
jgi:hypothetical protein